VSWTRPICKRPGRGVWWARSVVDRRRRPWLQDGFISRHAPRRRVGVRAIGYSPDSAFRARRLLLLPASRSSTLRLPACFPNLLRAQFVKAEARVRRGPRVGGNWSRSARPRRGCLPASYACPSARNVSGNRSGASLNPYRSRRMPSARVSGLAARGALNPTESLTSVDWPAPR
jgi:hypothetical protein